jgi:hypothetical protein
MCCSARERDALDCVPSRARGLRSPRPLAIGLVRPMSPCPRAAVRYALLLALAQVAGLREAQADAGGVATALDGLHVLLHAIDAVQDRGGEGIRHSAPHRP